MPKKAILTNKWSLERTLMEQRARRKGFKRIAGVDEAGRGPLAGPVVAAACVIPKGFFIEGVTDSKQLTAEERCKYYEQLINHKEIDYGIGIIDALIIDEINILQATFKAMVIAIESLKIRPDYLLIDGPHLPIIDISSEGIVEGDALCFSISAASILAKETRDRIMQGYHLEWPHYGFDQHKGYATPQHLAAVQLYGPCPIHRRSFHPIKPYEKP